MITPKMLLSAMLLVASSLSSNAVAATITINFAGSGVSANLQLTYGPVTDARYPNAFEITGVTGVFSDTNNGLNIINASVGPLEPITHDTPEATNLLAPDDFSRFAVATGLPATSGGFLTYDNLYYPNGSPQTASDYPLHGGVLDIYGLMFTLNGGRVVDIWSNGTITGSGTGPIYGVAVATSAVALDRVGNVTLTPEPKTIALLAGGLLLLLIAQRRHSGARP